MVLNKRRKKFIEMASMFCNNQNNNEFDIVESFINRRRYTEKLLDQILHDSASSKRLSLSPEKSTCNISGIRSLDDTEKHSEHGSDVSEQVVFRNMTEVDQNVSINAKELEKPLENLYMVKALQSCFNIRSGSFSELVVNVRSDN